MEEKFKEPQAADEITVGAKAQTTAEAPANITIRVAQLGMDIVEVTGPKGMTVSQALNKAGMNVLQGLELRVNNSTCKPDRELHDGEIVMLVPEIVGGSVIGAVVAITDATHNVLDAMWFGLKQ